MNPLLVARIQRQWRVVAAAVALMAFMVLHVTVFQPALKRYKVAVKQATDMGMTLDPDRVPRMMPARVFALLTDNAMPAAVADQQGGSGELTSAMLEEITRLAGQHGMNVISTEPGPAARLPHAVQLRAQLRMSCTYHDFVAFLDDLSHSGRLISVDRFSLRSVESGRRVIDLWVTRYVIKRAGTRP